MKHGMLNQIKIAVIFLLVLVGCTEKETQVEVSSVSLNTATIEMIEGETFSLVATVLPKDAEYDGVMWASSNASVASVNSGTVTAVKEGTATITASAGGKSSTCTVKVSAKVVTVTSITLDKTSLSMQVGETETITATVNPDNATDKSVTWGSSDVSVATVADGRVTAKKSGEATITAKSGSCIAECKVTITVSTETVTLDKTTLSLAVGESVQLTATVKPDDATDKNVSWTSSDESVVKVDNGKVSALKFGKATITAKCGGKAAECAVTVTVPTGSVTLDKTTLSLAVGESVQLTATVKPDDATDKNVSWTSSDESIAKVDNGKVTAIRAGKATITAKCGGKTAECAVTVTVPTGSVTLDKTTLTLAVGETAQLTATVNPDDATDKNVAWASSDESVAKVANGKVTAVKAGKATITAKCGGKTAECAVTVTVPTGSVNLDKTALSLAVGETVQLTATVKPDDATDKNVAWTSSDESVAKVDNGKVTAVKSGKAMITAKCGGKTAECVVTVTVPVSSITLDKTALSLAVGESTTLTATVKPDDATDKNVAWYSSDESIAKVDNGRVTALKIGSATVTSTLASFSVSCKVTVIHPDNVIYYTSTDGNIVKPFNESAFGANIISNEYNDGLGKIVFDSPVIRIGNNAFYECKTLRSMTLPESVTSIGNNAYYVCSALENVRLSEATLSIGKGAFYACGKLDVILTKCITFIDDKAFSWALAPNTILEIPASVRTIGASAFEISNISKVVLNDGLVSIGKQAFHLSSLKEVLIPNTVTSIGEAAFSSTHISGNVNIPGAVSSINNYLFSESNITSLVINNGTTTIGSRAFRICRKLTTISLPDTIESIGYEAFSDCSVLTDFYIKSAIPPTLNRSLEGCNSEVNIWVPRASVEAYKEKWSAYKDNIKAYDF